MTNQEKIYLLEEMLDLENDTLSVEMELKEIKNWDSIAVISFIALLDDKFGKQINAVQLKEFKKISDLLRIME